MRKRRVVIYDNDPDVADVLKEHFKLRGYEALIHRRPLDCPAYEDKAACKGLYLCADIILADLNMPFMTGLEMLRVQSQNGCKIPSGSRALMSGALDDGRQIHDIKELGCMFFQKPFSFQEIAAWLDECEKQMDLSQPLGMRRKEKRVESYESIACLIGGNDELVVGAVLNKSASGLCLKAKCCVREGQTVAVRSGLTPAPRTASVQWVRTAEDGSSLMGLKFA